MYDLWLGPQRMAAMSFFEFEDACSFRVFENLIYSVDICFRQHVHVHYFVGSRFHVAMHSLKSLKHIHHFGTLAVGLSVNPVGAVAATSNNIVENWNVIFDPHLHSVAVAQSFSEGRNVSKTNVLFPSGSAQTHSASPPDGSFGGRGIFIFTISVLVNALARSTAADHSGMASDS
jgi:hypothetical protein